VQGGRKGEEKRPPISNIYGGNVHKILKFLVEVSKEKEQNTFMYVKSIWHVPNGISIGEKATHSLTHSLTSNGPTRPTNSCHTSNKRSQKSEPAPTNSPCRMDGVWTENTFPLYLHPSTYLVVMSRLTSDFPTYLVTRVPYLITYL
jgi:hypothetical protein